MLIRSKPWLVAAVLLLAAAVAVALGVGFSTGGTAVPQAVSGTTPTTTAGTGGVTSSDVRIANFGLIATGGFEFDLEAPASPPGTETVVLKFTGPGIAPTDT